MGKFRDAVCGLLRRRKEPDLKDASYREAPFLDEVWWSPNEDEITLIKHTWPCDSDIQEALGQEILGYILDRSALHKQLFVDIDKCGKKWRQSLAYKQQSTKFNETIDQCVQQLSRPRKIERFLFDIGAAHCRLLPVGFKVIHWEIFKPALIHAMHRRVTRERFPDMSDEDRRFVLTLWGHMAVYMTRKMFLGYCDAFAVLDSYLERTGYDVSAVQN